MDRVIVDGESLLSNYTCSTIYLYKFTNAEIDSNYESESSTEYPSSSGYIYSTEKLKIGDTITVWNEFRFGEKTSSWIDERKRGAEAIVDEIVCIYKVNVKTTSDTYIITYYSVEGITNYTSVTNRDNLKEIQKHQIEVTKERVTIEYNT